MPRQLSVVLPVHDEGPILETVVLEWVACLDGLDLDYTIHAYDDGSRDGSGRILDRLARSIPRLRVEHHENRGHGPTILRGYREAAGEWILQVDSDGEVDPADFPRVWRMREGADVVLGVRTDRRTTVARKALSAMARWTVRWAFGTPVADPNCPFRLMRRSALRPLLPWVPDETFAPNVALTGLGVASGLRIREVPVGFRPRPAPPGRPFPLIRAGWRSLTETLAVAARYRADGGGPTP